MTDSHTCIHQVICTQESLAISFSPESVSDASRIPKLLADFGSVTPGLSISTASTLVASEMTDIDKGFLPIIPSHAVAVHPELLCYSYLEKGVGKDRELRERLVLTFRSISNLLLKTSSRARIPLPLGMIYLPGSFIKEKSKLQQLIKPPSGKEEFTPNLWYLCFLSEDCYNASSVLEEGVLTAIELPFDIEFLFTIHPFLKVTLAVLLGLKFSFPGEDISQLSPFLSPFNGYFISRQLEAQHILEAGVLYEEMIATGGKGKPVQKPQSSGRGSIYSPRRGSTSPSKIEQTPKRKFDESISACVRFLDLALASFYVMDLKRQCALAFSRLNVLSPHWNIHSNMVQVQVGRKSWWVSRGEAASRWSLLSIISPTAIGLGYSCHKNSVDTVEKLLPTSSAISRSAEEEIYANLVNEVKVRDGVLASKCAKLLSREGCESWNDVLNLPDYVAVGENGHAAQFVNRFLYENNIPAVAAGKIAAYVQKNR